MTDAHAGNTLALTIQPVDAGYPAIVDAAFTAAISAASQGGQGTQDYFDSENQTPTFWDLVASQDITFAPGVDPLGGPVALASSGNVELRIQAVWTGAADALGVLTITTQEVSGSGISRLLTGTITVASNPSTVEIDGDAFTELLPAIYESAETMLLNLARSIPAASRVESPDVDAESLTAEALFATSEKASASRRRWSSTGSTSRS